MKKQYDTIKKIGYDTLEISHSVTESEHKNEHHKAHVEIDLRQQNREWDEDKDKIIITEELITLHFSDRNFLTEFNSLMQALLDTRQDVLAEFDDIAPYKKKAVKKKVAKKVVKKKIGRPKGSKNKKKAKSKT